MSEEEILSLDEDGLVEEGYRLLSPDTAIFAAAAEPVAAETWPEWEEHKGVANA